MIISTITKMIFTFRYFSCIERSCGLQYMEDFVGDFWI